MMAIRNYWFPIQSIMIHHILLILPIETTGKSWSHQHPLPDDYLNRQHFQLEQNYTSYQFDIGGNCRHVVRDFSVEDVVACFDSLSAEKQRKPMHIAFIGDSTVRLHYINFLRLLPDYDRQLASESKTFRSDYFFQEDRNVTFPLMDNLMVSFRWRPRIDEFLLDDFKQWASGADNSAPDFILIGMLVHYFIRYDNEESKPTFNEFRMMLERHLVPLINRSQLVNRHQEIIWLRHSQPMTQHHKAINVKQHKWMNDEMIETYNEYIGNVLQSHKTKVVIWDAISLIVDQHFRACSLTKIPRKDPTNYFNCHESYHPGLAALSIGTQLIVNHLCHPRRNTIND